MKKLAKLISLVGLLALTSCETIYFKKEATSPTYPISNESYHHIGIFGLVEFSDPYNPQKTCSDWSSIRSENSFLSGLISTVTYNIYSPRTVSVVCSQK